MDYKVIKEVQHDKITGKGRKVKKKGQKFHRHGRLYQKGY